MQTRFTLVGVILIAVIAGTAGYVYLLQDLFHSSSSSQRTSSVPPTVIYFKRGSFIPPQNWSDIQGLNTPGFRYPINYTVVIGVNNTIEWVNNDTVEHTVIALSVPQGVTLFDSGFIGFGKSFTLTLTVPGVYKYDCAWHPWLAGIIRVKSA